MPNHVQNVLIFDGPPEHIACMLDSIKIPDNNDDDIDNIDFPNNIGTINFNAIVPMPVELNITSVCGTDDYIAAYLIAATSDNYADYGIDALSEDKYKEYIAQLSNKYNIDISREHISNERLENRLNAKNVALGRQYLTNLQKYGAPTWYEWCVENWGTKWNAYDFVRSFEPNTIIFHTAWSCALNVIKQLSKMYPDITFTYRWADEDFGTNVGECTFTNGVMLHKNVPKNCTKEAFELAAAITGESPESYDLVYDNTVGNYVPIDDEYDDDEYDDDEYDDDEE